MQSLLLVFLLFSKYLSFRAIIQITLKIIKPLFKVSMISDFYFCLE